MLLANRGRRVLQFPPLHRSMPRVLFLRTCFFLFSNLSLLQCCAARTGDISNFSAQTSFSVIIFLLIISLHFFNALLPQNHYTKMSAPDIDDPSNWVESTDPASGQSYWINRSTNETSWSPPSQVTTSGDGQDWEELHDDNTGRAYFVNKTSRRATWSRPGFDELTVQERFFRYVDKRGKEQGPFPESKMQEWFSEGYFKAEVKCKEETSTQWSTIGKFFADDDEEEEEEEVGHGNGNKRGGRRSSLLISPEGDVVESKVSSLREEINALNSEIGGTFRMTSIAQQNSSNNTTNAKRGSLYVREKGMISSSFNERYVCLEGNKISWYDDESDVGKKARGALVLTPASKASAYSDADEDDFKGFRVTGEGDDLLMQAPRYMAMKAWINAVQKSVDELTGKKHTEILETMTDSALSQVSKLSRLHAQLNQVVTAHIAEVASTASSSPKMVRASSRGSLGNTDVMSEILLRCTQLGVDIKEWGAESETQLYVYVCFLFFVLVGTEKNAVVFLYCCIVELLNC